MIVYVDVSFVEVRVLNRRDKLRALHRRPVSIVIDLVLSAASQLLIRLRCIWTFHHCPVYRHLHLRCTTFHGIRTRVYGNSGSRVSWYKIHKLFSLCIAFPILEVNPCIVFMSLHVLYRFICSPDVCRGPCCSCYPGLLCDQMTSQEIELAMGNIDTFLAFCEQWQEAKTQGHVVSLQLQCTTFIQNCIFSHILSRFTYVTYEVDDCGVNRIEHINWHWVRCRHVAEQLSLPLNLAYCCLPPLNRGLLFPQLGPYSR